MKDPETTQRARYPFVWRPAGSKGPHVGLLLGVAGSVCAVFLVSSLGDVDLWPSAFALGAVAVCAEAAAVIGFVGAWRVSTLRYVLSPGALEIRSGGAYLRIRYGQIERITAVVPDDAGPAPALWSGAHFGYRLPEHGSRYIWRATSADPDHLVAVDAGRLCYVLSPQDAQAFRRALVARADAMPAESPTLARTEVGWLDQVAGVDGWVRTLLVIGVLFAGALLKVDLLRNGAPQPDSLATIVILGVNAALVLGFSGQAPAVARLLVGAALALEVVAILW